MEKTIIEESTVELLEFFEKVSEEARKEKAAVPPTSKMLYYWTRKPLVVGKAVILSSTLNDIEKVKKLMDFRKDTRVYKNTVDVNSYKKELGLEPSKIKLLDPFAGAGNLLFEAKKLGLDCTGSDYNPVAYLLENAVLNYPGKYDLKLADDVEKFAKQVIDKTQKEIGKFFKPTDLVYLWVWCIVCPHCNQKIPLTNQMFIANSKKNQVGVRFHITDNKNFKTELVNMMTPEEGKQFTQKSGKAICISCKNAISYKQITESISNKKERKMIAIQIQQSVGNRKYRAVTEKDEKLYKESLDFVKSKYSDWSKLDLIPFEEILSSHRREHTLWHYGIKNWNDFFSPRQLLVLITFLKNTKEICKNIKNKEYAKAISLYLGLLLCKHVNDNCLGALWSVTFEKPAHALTLRRPSFVFNHIEVNPFEKVSGSFLNILKNITDGIKFASKNKNNIKLSNISVTKIPTLSKKYDLILTDPPYLDDVQYGELSEFFYVWLYRCLIDYFPELPKRVPLEEDFCESWGRFGDKKLAGDFFEAGLKKSFVSMNQILEEDGLLVVFFAHSTIKAWNMLLDCIRNAKFKVISSYAIHTESTSNVIARGKTSFMSSIIVVCRKLTEESTTYFENITPQIEDKIKNMINKIPAEKLLVLPITDLLIMAYGKILEVCTEFTELKSYEKDFEPDFKTLIKGSDTFVMKTIITKLTDRSLNALGPLTAFYLLVKIFHGAIISSDDALKFTRIYGINYDSLQKNNIGIKEGNTIRLFHLQENELDINPEEIDRSNLHQQLCYLVQVSKKEGASKIKSIINKKEFRVDDLKQIILILIKSFRLRINKNEKVNDSEKEELRLLEAIADVMGIKTSTEKKGGMDEFL